MGCKFSALVKKTIVEIVTYNEALRHSSLEIDGFLLTGYALYLLSFRGENGGKYLNTCAVR